MKINGVKVSRMAGMGLTHNKMTGIPSIIFIYAIFLAYPLAFHDYYYDIVTCKYVLLIAMTLMLSIFTLLLDGKIYLKKMYLQPSDYIVLCLFFINLLSVAGSEYKFYALNGADGRFNGLVTVFLYVLIYFILSRGDFNKDKICLVLAAGSILVSVLGILNFADIDILGFYNGLEMDQKQFYMSTIGHVNVYSSYFALTVPVLMIRYLEGGKMKQTIFYFVALLVNVLALLCGGCESAAIIIITAVVCSVLYCKGLHMRKWICLLVFVLALNKVFIYINEQSAEQRVLSNTVKILGDNRVVAAVILICVGLIPAEILLHQKERGKTVKYAVVFISSLFIIIYLAAFIYFTFIDRKAELHGMEVFLRFSDEFGSYRGYIWKVVVREFHKLSPYQMLFGIGTDTLRPYLVDRYGADMYNVTMAYYDNAHNEFLQYLITTGIAGISAYVLFLVMQIRKSLGQTDKIILCSVICYIVQSVVNINQVVTTPLFVVMLSML